MSETKPKEFYRDDDFVLYEGKMQDVLDTFEDNSIDCIVTDPPYCLTSIQKRFGKENSAENQFGNDGSFQRLTKGFMGKEWDNEVAMMPETWEKCYRVLKSGGYLLAFGGTRTYHRIACAIEDAGFEIRDCIMWLYGSGFPKSMNVGLAIDKKNGCGDRGHRIAVANRFHPDGTLEPNGEMLEKYEGKTKEGKEWQGWGTALKPAYEPIIVARKPIENSVANNVLKYGVGGINIDECRIYGETITNHDTKKGTFAGKVQTMPKMSGGKLGICNFKTIGAERIEYTQHEGRFPANVILTYDDTDFDEVCGGMPDTSSTTRNPTGGIILNPETGWNKNSMVDVTIRGFNDGGNASRYFYCAKASKKDRDEGLKLFEEKRVGSLAGGDNQKEILDDVSSRFRTIKKNTHPTVKPVELMQYLIRLVAPKGSTILDCFMGSGSTGKAVMFENRERKADYKFIGVEVTKEYLPIAKSRILYARDKYEYDFKEQLDDAKKQGQQNIFDYLEEN